MDIKALVDLQFTIFIIMMIGIVLRNKNIITASGKKSLTDIFINVILPCNIIHSFQIDMSMQILISSGYVLIIAIGIQMLALVINEIAYRKIDENKRVVFKYGTICSNAGLIGNSICENIYGLEGLLYASIYLIPQRLCMWSVGVAYFEKISGKKVIKQVCTHPCIIAVAIGFILMIFHLELPVSIQKSLTYLSDCNLPLSMIIIGSILADVKIGNVINKDTLYYCIMRLVIIPLLVLVVCVFLPINLTVMGVCVTLAGMPAGTTTAILAEKYHRDSLFASACVFISTLLSLITTPLLYVVIMNMAI